MDLIKGFSFVSEDGVHVRIEETPEHESIVLSLFREGKTETARLDKDMFEAIADLKYKITLNHSTKEAA